MSVAKLKVRFAGPLVSVQDAGRFGHLRFGVPASGPMDRLAFAAAQMSLGQADDAPGIEISLGGLVLDCTEGEVSVAVTGGGFRVALGTTPLVSWSVVTLRPGDSLSLRGGAWGSWCYLAFAGALQTRKWLGHSATHTLSGLGGGAVAAGDVLTVEEAKVLASREGEIALPASAKPDGRARVVIGPQERYFEQSALDTLLSQPYRLTDAFDRMGVRLDGPVLALKDALSIPSEPILRGSIQVPGNGVPAVLMADHGTTGGYPKIATVLPGDLDRMAQLRAGDTVRFTEVTPDEAIAHAREAATTREAYLMELAKPKASLSERLMRENLIGGIVGPD